jgi:hypothetical protein
VRKTRSFDVVIFNLIVKELGIEVDIFGADKGRVKTFSPEDRMEDRE